MSAKMRIGILATGTAVLGSFDVGSEMDRTLREAACGYCVEAGDAKALADAILELKEDKERVRQMGENARRYAVAHAAKEQAVGKYIEIIEKLG